MVKILRNFRKVKLAAEHSKALLRDAKVIMPASGFSVFLNENVSPLSDQFN